MGAERVFRRNPAVPAQRGPSAEQGFSLLELSVALGVLAVGLLAMGGMQLQALSGSRSANHTTAAAAIVESQMEQLQRVRWTNLAPTGGWTPGVTVSRTVETGTTEVEQDYTLSWRIADATPDWARSVDVRVTWAEPNRSSRSFTLSNVRFNREAL